MSLHQPIGATRVIPLAPPATDKPSNLKSNLQNWASWLSPRVARPTRKQRSHSDDENDKDDKRYNKRGLHQTNNFRRPRGSSLDDQTQAGSRGATGSSAGEYLISQSRSADEDKVPGKASGSWYSNQREQQQQQSPQQQRRSGSGSLLTAFLLYFDALLPEYFSYLPSASDVENNGAAKAVSVLERGARTVHLHAVSPIYKRYNSNSPTDRHQDANRSCAPPPFNHSGSPLLTSKNEGEKSSNIGINAGVNQHHNQQWLTREKIQRVAGQVSPRHIKSMKFNSSLQAEWERFTSPFLMLAGAEVLYGEMEHAIDPETERRFVNGESLFAGSDAGRESSSTAVQFDSSEEQKDSNAHSSVSTSDSSNKRGSRRLIAMYRQVREDFIIVGEYLCDPVLGSHGSIGAGVSISNNGSMMDNTPQSTFEMSPETSPPKVYGRSRSQPLTPEHNRTSVQFSPSRALDHHDASSDEAHRQHAARSLRNTLNALIAFIDARCVLVKIHADLCCWPHEPLTSTVEGNRGGNKWAALAEQCRTTIVKMSFWTLNKDSMVQLVLSKLETETKALELALLSVHHLMECDFFNCILHVRKLHVLLRHTAQPSLQLKWMKTSLRRILSMMKIIFGNNANDSPLLSRSPSLLKHKAQKPDEARQLEQIFIEFMAANESGPPLAVIVVHKTAQNECEEEVDSVPVGTSLSCGISWTPLYMKSTLDKNNRADTANVQTRNNPLVQMIRDNFGGSNENKARNSSAVHQSDSERGSWPFTDWPQIERKLTAHFGLKTRTYNICSSPTKHTNSPILANQKQKPKPIVTSKCHIVRITEAISIIAVQGASLRTKQRQVSSLEESLGKLALRFRPENILSVSSVLQAKSTVASRPNKTANERGENSNQRSEMSALWSGTGWSDVQRKQVLHSLGLRSKHSPVVSAPLKSPYVRRQMSRMRQRKRKKKNSLNTGHLAMFLGPELSHLI